MAAIDAFAHPKLRPIDARPLQQNGQSYLLLRDPLELTEGALLVPHFVGPALALCDGTRAARDIGADIETHFGFRLGENVIAEMLQALDAALLLDNERYRRAYAAALAEYRSAAFRPPALAGRSYPDDPATLRQTLQSYLDDVAADVNETIGRAVISPHIDYRRGAAVYARVWQRARASVQAADLVVLFGTDHAGSNGRITLTRQNYATPFGVLPTPTYLVDELASALGEDLVFAEELHHRAEHSIELAAVWLHYLRNEQPCELLPVLTGSFGRFIEDGVAPPDDAALETFIRVLQTAARARNVLFVAAGDLAHIGPAFGGESAPAGGRARETLRAADNALLARICAGDAEGFLTEIKTVQDANNVCGVAPIYLTLRMTGAARGELVAYEQCPADEENTSTVSICGVVLD